MANEKSMGVSIDQAKKITRPTPAHVLPVYEPGVLEPRSMDLAQLKTHVNKDTDAKLTELEGEESSTEKVAAAALAQLSAQVSGIQHTIAKLIAGEIGFDRVLADRISTKGADNILYGTATPDSAPAFAGQIYIDTNNAVAYIATANNRVSDWKTISA